MKRLVTLTLVATLLAFPVMASAQTDAVKTAVQRTMMNCPMMANVAAMDKDLGIMMDDVQDMIKTAADTETKDQLQGMHERLSAMKASMQKMCMTGPMMGRANSCCGQAIDRTVPDASDTVPGTSTGDAPAHHSGQ